MVCVLTGWSTSLVFAFYTRYLNVSFFVVDVLSSPGSYGALEVSARSFGTSNRLQCYHPSSPRSSPRASRGHTARHLSTSKLPATRAGGA